MSRVVLRNISWETYELLMKDHESKSSPRFTYEDGELEIEIPSMQEERINRLFDPIVSLYIEGKDGDALFLGSTTFKLKSAGKGVEPDSCYYIQNAEQIRKIEEIDLKKHPAPDLVVEIDITPRIINRFPIYAEFGVNEIWQYKKDRVKIFKLSGKEYFKTTESQALPKVTGEILTKFIAESETEKSSVWLNNIRQWIAENC
jgi:Uma2 family endonuclease